MNKYTEWLEAASTLRAAKKLEISLRNALLAEFLEEKLEGSATHREDGYIITQTAKLTRTIDREVLEVIWDELTDRERECIDYKPSLKLTQYKRIELTGGKLLEAITIKPAQAALKVIPEDVA
jgi:hypothetical protein